MIDARLAGAIRKVREAIAEAAELPVDSIPADDDLINDLQLTGIEREQAGLYLAGIFSVLIPDTVWCDPLYGTPAALAEWLIAKSKEASWAERHAQRKRA